RCPTRHIHPFPTRRSSDLALGRESVRAMLYRESQIDGRLVNLRAADDLARFVRVRSGRLPQTCVPSHCEVLRLEGAGPVPSKSTDRKSTRLNSSHRTISYA